MKLWWPHSEAMIAFLMGYSESGDPALLRLFYQVAEYTFRQVRGGGSGQPFLPRRARARLGGGGKKLGRDGEAHPVHLFHHPPPLLGVVPLQV